MMYRVGILLSRRAAAELDALPLVIHARILRVFERLRHWPRVSGAKPLTGPWTGYYRARTGDYRVLFRVQGNKLIIERIGHRDRFYEG